MYKNLIYNPIILNLLQSKNFLAWWMKLPLIYILLIMTIADIGFCRCTCFQ